MNPAENTVTVTYTFSKKLAERLEAQGLLRDSEFVERTLWAKLEKDWAWRNLQEVFQDADADPERMTMEEVVAEIKAYRAERRAQDASRS